jgi:hypothetical protein
VYAGGGVVMALFGHKQAGFGYGYEAMRIRVKFIIFL